ncbi:hypothetical protein SLS62_010297 [Diatrype stigma]|uniref:Major facilitator superfamily (MFS) profile domain-containing protein n=1 Tax=Diatrype stigma TaxID=117547 RepID=A0AAN9UA46_9PEZI
MPAAHHFHRGHRHTGSLDTAASLSRVRGQHASNSVWQEAAPRKSSGSSLQLPQDIVNSRSSFTQDVLESLHRHSSSTKRWSFSPLPEPLHEGRNGSKTTTTDPDVPLYPLNTYEYGARETDGDPPTSTMGPAAAASRETLSGPPPPRPRPRASTRPPYPSAAKTALIMFSLYIAIFLVALDRTILGPAIPAITDEFDSIGDIGWYTSAYMLTACGFILPYGRVYTLFPAKPVFLSGIALFEAGSAVCGAAPSSLALILGRAVQGLGSSAVFTGAVLIMTRVVPLRRRPLLQGLFGACFGVASVVGPLLGGVFTGSSATWRWCFYVNLPIGAFTVGVVVLVLRLGELDRPPPLPPLPPLRLWGGRWRGGAGAGGTAATTTTTGGGWIDTARNLDPLGTLLFLPSVTCLLLALQWGGAEGSSWGAPRVVALLVVFGVLLAAFGAWQWATRGTTATVPGRVLLQRSVAMGGLSQFCVGAVMLTVATYIPLWFQAIRGASAMQSGVDTIPLVLSVVFGSVASGGLVQRWGRYAPFMLAGSCLMAVGAGLLAMRWSADSPPAAWIGFQVVLGLGVGSTMQHPNLAVQVVLPAADIATGTALLAVCQTLGGAVFVAVAQNLFLTRFTAALEALDPASGIDLARVTQSGATDLTQIVPADVLPAVLEAYNDSLTRGPFFAALIVACLAVPAALGMEWRNVKDGGVQDKMVVSGDEESASGSSLLLVDQGPRGDGSARGIGEKTVRDGPGMVPGAEQARD